MIYNLIQTIYKNHEISSSQNTTTFRPTLDIYLKLDIRPILNISFIFNVTLAAFCLYVKSYIFSSQKSRTIYQHFFTLINSMRQIMLKYELLYAIDY